MTKINEYSLKNDKLEVRFLNIGGAITKIALAEDDFSENLVLAYNDPSRYLDNAMFLNTIIGRTSNRIKDGRFQLEGQVIQLDLNDGPNNLHGGVDNLTHKFFDVSKIPAGFELKTTLPHQENGFPGTMQITVRYELEEAALVITYEAVTDQTTVVNLTHHAYFNLSGNLSSDVMGHTLEIPSRQVAEVDETSAFTEMLLNTKETVFDFTKRRFVQPGDDLLPHPLMDQANGYDHLFLLENGQDAAATFEDPQSGRRLVVRTTEPAMQFYGGNYIDAATTFEKGRAGIPYLGACFETHKVPYDYDSQILRPGEVYRQKTSFEFSKN